MPNDTLNKISVDNTVYDIEDATARADIKEIQQTLANLINVEETAI